MSDSPPKVGSRAWLRTARRALSVMRGYAVVGLVLAVGLMVVSFLSYPEGLARWICRLGAMGSLLGATAGLNIMDRMVRGLALPIGLLIGASALVGVALLGVGMGAMQYDLGAFWSPLVAATYIFVLARILMRFRSTD